MHHPTIPRILDRVLRHPRPCLAPRLACKCKSRQAPRLACKSRQAPRLACKSRGIVESRRGLRPIGRAYRSYPVSSGRVRLFLSRAERSQSKTPRYTSQDRGPSVGPPPGLLSRPIRPRQRVAPCPSQALSCGSDDARLSAPFCPPFTRILPSIVRRRGRGLMRRGARPGPGETCYKSLLRWHGDWRGVGDLRGFPPHRSQLHQLLFEPDRCQPGVHGACMRMCVYRCLPVRMCMHVVHGVCAR